MKYVENNKTIEKELKEKLNVKNYQMSNGKKWFVIY